MVFAKQTFPLQSFLKLAFHKFYLVDSFVSTLWYSNFLKAFVCKETELKPFMKERSLGESLLMAHKLYI